MNAIDAADILWETGIMIGLSRGSKSKSQGFLKLSKWVEDLEEDWQQLTEKNENNWKSLPEDLQEAFLQLKENQSFPLYKELQEQLGGQAPDILRVRGIGPAMARKIQQTLDIWSLEKLEEAIANGELLQVRGIGKKVLEQLKTQMAITKNTQKERADKRERLELRLSLKDKVREALEQIPVKKEVAIEPKKETQKTAKTPEDKKAPLPKIEKNVEETGRHPIEEVLRSPISHKTGLTEKNNSLNIPGTGEQYLITRGIIDFLPQSNKSPETLAQRLMETPAYSRFYEEIFRPGFTRILAQHSAEEDIELSVEMLSPGTDWGILDVACGTGNYTRAIARQVDPARGFVIALDLSWPMLRRAAMLKERGGFRHVHLVRGDAQDLPIADELLEAVHCTAAFHIIPDPKQALKEFHRVTQPGGKLVIGTFIQSKRFLPLRLLQRYASPLMRWFSQEDLEAHIRNAGYRILRTHVDGLAITISAEKI